MEPSSSPRAGESVLTVKRQWLDRIFSADPSEAKTLEIRGSNTRKRGRILLCESGSFAIQGSARLVDAFKIESDADFVALREGHRVASESRPYGERTHAWCLEAATRFAQDVPFLKKKRGAVVWSNFE